LIIFVVTHSGVRSIDVPVGRTLFTRVRLARISRRVWMRRPTHAAPCCARLFDILIGPARAAGLLAGAHARRHPACVVGVSPFALIDRASGQYLVEQYAVLLSPSAASLAAVRDGRGASVLSAGTVFAPFPDELPATRAEAIAVKQALTNTASYVGRDASEHAVRAALSSSGVVHVATHGVLNVRSPMFSRRLMRAAEAHVVRRRPPRCELLDLTIQKPAGGPVGLRDRASRVVDFVRAARTDAGQAFLFAGPETSFRPCGESRTEAPRRCVAFCGSSNRPPVEALAGPARAQGRKPRHTGRRTLVGGHLAASALATFNEEGRSVARPQVRLTRERRCFLTTPAPCAALLAVLSSPRPAVQSVTDQGCATRARIREIDDEPSVSLSIAPDSAKPPALVRFPAAVPDG
jgi:hypothetical protein